MRFEDIREGDAVFVRAVALGAASREGGRWHVMAEFAGLSGVLYDDDVGDIEPAWRPGDRVTWRGGDGEGVLIAVHDDYAWIDDGGAPATLPLASLIRVTPKDFAAAPAASEAIRGVSSLTGAAEGESAAPLSGEAS